MMTRPLCCCRCRWTKLVTAEVVVVVVVVEAAALVVLLRMLGAAEVARLDVVELRTLLLFKGATVAMGVRLLLLLFSRFPVGCT